MKKLFLPLVIFFSITLNTYSQTFNLQFIEIHSDGTNGGNFDVKVQIAGSQVFKLATSNITFNFNYPALSSPTLLIQHHYDNNDNLAYSDMGLGNPLDGVVSINITFNQNDASLATDVPLSPTWQDVATIRFTINDNSQTSGMTFRSASAPQNPMNVNKCTGSGVTYQTMPLNGGTWNSLDVPLPVELSSFTALVNQNVVNLKWQTATEVNNYGFEIQRKVGSIESGVGSWEKVGFVKGNGNSNSPKDYNFTDKNLTGGPKFSYRLKQLDNDGTFTYSDKVEVEVTPKQFTLYQNYPNPFNPSTNIKFDLPEAVKVKINIYNILGENVATLLNETMEAGFHQITFNGSALSSGTYIYRIEAGNFVQTKKMLLMK